MTEEEWLTSSDPGAMLRFLRRTVSLRSLALFAVAACLRNERIVGDDRSRKTVQWAERLIEGLAKADDEDDPYAGDWPLTDNAANRCAAVASFYVEGDRASACYHGGEVVEFLLDEQEEPGPLAGLIRDIFGNPYRPVALDPAWLTSDVLALARGIYEEHAFDRMPILADALQDAGCDNEDILSHCRDPQQVHVRGCWVVDLLLGKS